MKLAPLHPFIVQIPIALAVVMPAQALAALAAAAAAAYTEGAR